MFIPQYTLTEKLIHNIAFCERLYGQLEGLRIPQSVELNLERKNEITATYISNSIEGNPLSLPEVTNLLLADRLPVNRDEKEVCNYFKILQSLTAESISSITLKDILRVHQTLLTGVNDSIAGEIRNKPIIVGKYRTKDGKLDIDVKHTPPAHQKELIEIKTQQLLKWLQSSKDPAIIKAGIFHHEFVYIHPFEDGNGRTCRLMTAQVFLQEQYQINKYFVLDDFYDVDRSLYSDSLNSADSGDKTLWLEYFTDGVKYSLQSALARIKKSLSMLPVEKRPTHKEKIVLELLERAPEVTSLEIAERLGVSRQQSHRLLSSLVKKGLIQKIGNTKASYYRLK